MSAAHTPHFLPPPYTYLKVFISHATEDKSTADYYAALLRPLYTVWSYEQRPEMYPGSSDKTLNTLIRDAIERCDYFLLLVSDHSRLPGKPWCARELGLARKLQQIRKSRGGISDWSVRPVIVPILVKHMTWREKGDSSRPRDFPVRDFETGREQEPLVFEVCHDPHVPHPPRTDKDLASFMKPQLKRVRRDILTEEDFDECGVFDLYETLFEKTELDPREDIKDWTLRLEDGVRRFVPVPTRRSFFGRAKYSNFHFQQDSLFYVVSLYNRAIALSYLNYHPDSKLVVAHYIAVGTGWRANGLAEKFVEAIQRDVSTDYPQARGVLFVIEPIDLETLTTFLASGNSQALASDHPVYKQIRRFKRLEFYQRTLSASVYVDRSTGTPLVYTEPCLDIEESRSNWSSLEEDYWVVWKSAPHGGEAPSWTEVVNVICIEVHARSVVFRYPNETGAAFWKYANDLARRMKNRAIERRVTQDRVRLKNTYSQLTKIVTNYREIAV